MSKNEKWKNIKFKSYGLLFEVSNFSRVRNKKTGIILNSRVLKKHHHVTLVMGELVETISVTELVKRAQFPDLIEREDAIRPKLGRTKNVPYSDIDKLNLT